MDYQLRATLILLLSLCSFPAYAQFGEGTGYEFSARPDFWYNDVDGIQLGTLLEGRVPGTDEEGPHRLDLGVWVGTWWPDLPVSYSLTYTEPIPVWSDYGSEFNVQLTSFVREGYHEHGFSVNKRWQAFFDFRNFWQTGFSMVIGQRFEDEYALFPNLWSDELKPLLQPYLSHQRLNSAGLFNLDLLSRLHLADPFFYTASLSATQQVLLGESWEFRLRFYGEIADDQSFPEYLLLRSSGAEIQTLDSRLARAKGTVPVPWTRNGYVHFASGPNLRGYTHEDIGMIVDGIPALYSSVAATNAEFDLPNPIQLLISNEPQLSEFLSFRSYIFGDAATFSGFSGTNDGFFADAGAGIALTLNIPDYQGRPRGFVLRYEAPAWLSDPVEEPVWKWRHLIGFGATITF